MVDAGGHRLRMLVSGSGSPAVVIEDGFGSSIIMRAELQARLAKFSRVVAYDHAGTGGSESGPEPRHAAQVAIELREALRNAQVSPPYVLVGASIGADYISVFADLYPEDVAGLVRIDPTPDFDEIQKWLDVNAPSRADALREMLTMGDSAMQEMMGHQEPGRQAEWAALDVTRQQACDANVLAPVVQITGAVGHQTNKNVNDKVKFFDDWLAKNMPNAKHVLAEKSGHAVFASDPQLVIDEIRKLVNTIRKSEAEPAKTEQD